MTKEEFAKTIPVPKSIETNKYEPVTQEEFTQGLLAGIKLLALSMDELVEIKENKIPISALRAIITMRHM